jgi:hypothetical protein
MECKTRLNLLALPFSTEDVLAFEMLAAEKSEYLTLKIDSWLSTGSLLDELARPMVKVFDGDGILISDHKMRSGTELLAAISVLKKFDMNLYSLSHGLEPLSRDSI